MSNDTLIEGRPVTFSEGKPSRYGGENLPPQKPIGDFVTVLDLLFALGAVSVKWHQYTPYFNDGDPCTFHAGEFAVRFPETPEDAGDYEDGHWGEYDDGFRHDHKDAYAVFKQNLDYREAKAFYQCLNEAFGDPAEIVATPEGFNVEDYEHE